VIKLTDLKDRHKDDPIMVLGGGPSLAEDYWYVRRRYVRPILVAVNHHAICAGIEPDYMVFMDDPIHHPLLFQAAKDYGGTKVCPLLEYTDVDMRGVQYWNGPSSALPAAWLACWMGGDPVFLCGFDLYQGEVMYCHPGEREDKPVYKRPLEDHLKRWKAGWRRYPEMMERIRAVSGPLVEVFGPPASPQMRGERPNLGGNHRQKSRG